MTARLLVPESWRIALYPVDAPEMRVHLYRWQVVARISAPTWVIIRVGPVQDVLASCQGEWPDAVPGLHCVLDKRRAGIYQVSRGQWYYREYVREES